MFSVESILFSDDSNRSSETIVPVSLKTSDACIKDAVNSLEELEFIDTYAKINDHNQRLKMQMCKRLANITNNIRNSQARNSCESYLYNAAFSTEAEKESGWVKRMWDAIVTACKRVIDAIVNFIRWIGTVIAGLDTKKQIEHYKLYLDNKSKIAQATEKLKNKKIKCPTWKIDKNKITETNRKFKVVMMMMLKEMNGKDQGVSLIKKMSTAADEEMIVKFFEDAKTAGDLSKLLKEGDVDKFSENIESGIRGIMGISEQSKLSPKEIVSKFAFTNSQNVETHISKIKQWSDDFSCLAEDSILKQTKELQKDLKEFQKSFTYFTQNVKKLSEAFIKISAKEQYKDAYSSADTSEDKKNIKKTYKNDINSIRNIMSKLTNSRIRTNSRLTAISLEWQMMVLRFNKTAHIALKAYLSEIKVLKGKDDKEAAKAAKTAAKTSA